MKILLLQPYLNQRGGGERVILKIAQHYNASIYLLEYSPENTFREFKDLDIKIVGKKLPFSNLLPYRASQGLRYGYNFYNLKIKEEYDVLNPHISPSEWIRNKNERVLWYCHTPPREVYDLYKSRMQNRSYKEKLLYSSMTKMYKFISGNVVKNIESIATNSSNTQSRIKKYYSRDSTIVNPGIDYEEFANNGDDNYFFYPSRISPNKQQDYVITAFRLFSKIEKTKKYSLILAGGLSKDPEHLSYYKKIKELSKGLNIKIKLNISDKELKDLYSNSTAVLLAPKNEDFGIVYLEAMSSSKPIISINEGEPKNFIVNGKNGFLINSAEEMSKIMLELITDKKTAEKIGSNARNYVIKNFSWNMFFKKFDLLLKKTSKIN